MDTHRYPEIDATKKAALAAFELARDLQPDIIITSDDNAAKYLIVPYLVDTATPVVFTGINGTVREYGFPAKNVTGMVEVAPGSSTDVPLSAPQLRTSQWFYAALLVALVMPALSIAIHSANGLQQNELVAERMRTIAHEISEKVGGLSTLMASLVGLPQV